MTPIEIIARSPSVEEYSRLVASAKWPERPPAACATALEKSLYAVCAVAGAEVVGMGRVIGDLGVCNYIQDVIVLPEYKKQGIGKKIMDALMRWLEENAAPGSCLALIAAPGVEDFYKRWGFASFPPDKPGMRRRI